MRVLRGSSQKVNHKEDEIGEFPVQAKKFRARPHCAHGNLASCTVCKVGNLHEHTEHELKGVTALYSHLQKGLGAPHCRRHALSSVSVRCTWHDPSKPSIACAKFCREGRLVHLFFWIQKSLLSLGEFLAISDQN